MNPMMVSIVLPALRSAAWPGRRKPVRGALHLAEFQIALDVGRDWMTAAITTATTTALTSLPIIGVLLCGVRCGMCVLAVGPQRLDLVGGEIQEAALAAVDVCVRSSSGSSARWA